MDSAEDDYSFANTWWPYIISGTIALVCTIRQYASGKDCPSDNRMDGKTVLITGGSSGIGFETAKELAKRGANIILTCRDHKKGQDAKTEIIGIAPTASIDVKLLDISIMANIRKFVDEISLQYTKIDVLINNAAAIFQPYKKTVEGFETTLATNYLGPFLLTHLLFPLLKNTDEGGRVINLSSLAHFSGKLNLHNLNLETGYNDKTAFAQSKLALVMFTRYLGELWKESGVTVNSASPGLVRGTQHMKKSPLQASWSTKVAVMPWVWLFMKTAKKGCQTVVYLAVDANLKETTGMYFSDCELQEPAQDAKDEEMCAKLYAKSCQLCRYLQTELAK